MSRFVEVGKVVRHVFGNKLKERRKYFLSSFLETSVMYFWPPLDVFLKGRRKGAVNHTFLWDI
jgi:hypothetical protein